MLRNGKTCQGMLNIASVWFQHININHPFVSPPSHTWRSLLYNDSIISHSVCFLKFNITSSIVLFLLWHYMSPVCLPVLFSSPEIKVTTVIKVTICCWHYNISPLSPSNHSCLIVLKFTLKVCRFLLFLFLSVFISCSVFVWSSCCPYHLLVKPLVCSVWL